MNSPEVNTRLGALIRALLKRTERGVIRWNRAADEQFNASLNRTSYSIQTLDGDGQPPHLFIGYDSDGIEVMRINSADLELEISEEVAGLYGTIRDLVINRDVIAFLDSALIDLADDEPPF